MEITTHSARITGPVLYETGSGHKKKIPLGPCLIESRGDSSIDVVWGAQGQTSAALSVEDIRSAMTEGHLVLLN